MKFNTVKLKKMSLLIHYSYLSTSKNPDYGGAFIEKEGKLQFSDLQENQMDDMKAEFLNLSS